MTADASLPSSCARARNSRAKRCGTSAPTPAAGEYEAMYSGMPPHGLGKITRLAPASERNDSARGRVGRTAQ